MVFSSILTLVFLFYVKTCSTLAEEDPVTNVTTVFVDAKNGSDKSNCGQRISPCKTVRFAIENVIMVENISTGIIFLFHGIYRAESVKMDCSTSPLETLIIQDLKNDTSEKVQVMLSADIIKCNIIFHNIHWKGKSSNPVLINPLIASVSFINSSVTDLSFSIIALGSNIALKHTMVKGCVGLQRHIPLVSASGLVGYKSKVSLVTSVFSTNHAPLISTREITGFHMKSSSLTSNNITMDQPLFLIDSTPTIIEDSYFISNTGSLMEMSHSTTANITLSVFRNNDVMSGSILVVGKQVVLHVAGCSFDSNFGISNGPVIRTTQLNNTSIIDVQDSYFSCNKVNESIHMPPIHSRPQSDVNCTNCSINSLCPVYCSAGSFLLEGTMCSLCPQGTFHPPVHNITAFTCNRCSPGYYNSASGSDACKPCQKGTFAAKSGSTGCLPCENNFMTSGEGESSCNTMTTGCVVLTVVVILLIVIPLLILAWKHLQNTSKKIRLKSRQDFKILCEETTSTKQ